ncbi:MAG: type III pantothenate kinase [Candidatus Omnitrophota bacterium]|nr:MAG: type III pantothenate kinase [Candidatus Omnitrophota bacterium]
MLLAIDIGNTNITFALINKQGKITRKYSIPTAQSRRLTYEIGLRSCRGRVIDKIFIVSVVPKALKEVKRGLKRKFKNTGIFVVGKDVKVPLKSLYNKREIGQDRLVTAFAARSLYGLPVLIIDFGTAVTFDVVSKKGVYLGGLILPGIKMSLESLSEKTAMLPKIYLKKTHLFIGKDTTSSIRSGISYGYSAICEGLIDLFRKRIDKNIKVIATGGDAPLISRYTPSMKRIDLDISLKGLYLLSL